MGWRDVMREARLAWDSLNYQWDLRVVNFDEDNQRTLLTQLGFDAAGLQPVIVGLVLLGVLAWWLRRPGRAPLDEAGAAWAEFCRKLAAAGVPRQPWEGPQRFGARAAASFREQRSAILRVAELYARIRYAPAAPAAGELREAVRALPPLQPLA
jgi:hypothetical protein